ncbi:putative tRNA-dihydrouridine synthase [Pseudolycoriella hygida]|uniref:tRNA-dihydrouridine(47) synthase [NAD(P)(+)] n=1 Tax=Pseudolycoriella hygida TaxID=35572 RepID=A0A9Q0N781_9DIPT|nr:putative tRNA-dihydrouridine synthase [Pseudolycoriella hygida]
MGLKDGLQAYVHTTSYDGSNEPQVRRAMEKIIERKTKIILGPLYSNLTSLIAAQAKAHNIIVITMSNNPALADTKLLVFGHAPLKQLTKIINYFADAEYKNFIALLPAGRHSHTVNQVIQNILIRKNSTLVRSEFYSPLPESIEKAIATVSASVDNLNEMEDTSTKPVIYIADDPTNVTLLFNSINKYNLDKKAVIAGDHRIDIDYSEPINITFPGSLNILNSKVIEKAKNMGINHVSFMHSMAYDLGRITARAIGDITLPHPVILAPMSGVTDLPFRKLVKKFSEGLVVSEMVASRAMIIETKQSLQRCAIIKEEATGSCVQLAGCEPEIIAESAKMNEDMGARIIDLNFGCPAKKIVGGYSGAALMRDEKLATKILEATVKAVKIPVTLKMRTGWDEHSRNAPTLAKIAYDVGVQMITIHGRTRCQFYSGKADWKFIKQVKDMVKIPVIANGDITSLTAAKQCLQESGADGVMVGRGVYGKPWFISQIAHYLKTGEELPPPSTKEQLSIIIQHYNDMLEYYGNNAVALARKHIGWYSSGLANSAEFRGKINLIDDPEEVKEKITEFYEKVIVVD